MLKRKMDKRLPKVIPVEVKSGKCSSKHASLDALMGVENFKLERAYVLHRRNVARGGSVVYLPRTLKAA